jgi:ADP-ribosylglycohydrolase
MPSAHAERLQRAYQSLIGLAVGDALGAFFEFSHGRISRRITERLLPNGQWHWTDDTQMALSLFAVLRRYETIDPDAFAASLAQQYERSRGYGRSVRAIVQRLRAGASWREVRDQLFDGQGSYGNGCASRVPPVGAYFADNLETVVEQARESAIVTHAHPEAIAGSIAVALAAAWAWQLRDAPPITRANFLDRVIAYVPDSDIRARLVLARDLPSDTSVADVVAHLGNGSDATVQTTVPFALWCAGEQLTNYEEAIWLTLHGQGDCDTTCAIVGGVVVMRMGTAGIPFRWNEACEPLPRWAFEEPPNEFGV